MYQAIVPFLFFVLSACAITTEGYTKEGATELQQKRDAYECERDVSMIQMGTMRDKVRLYKQCMESRGYKR